MAEEQEDQRGDEQESEEGEDVRADRRACHGCVSLSLTERGGPVGVSSHISVLFLHARALQSSRCVATPMAERGRDVLPVGRGGSSRSRQSGPLRGTASEVVAAFEMVLGMGMGTAT